MSTRDIALGRSPVWRGVELCAGWADTEASASVKTPAAPTSWNADRNDLM
jgi:hypothetical protein